MVNEYLREFKPKDAPIHYEECINCGGHDASYVLLEFGLCLKCWGKYKKKIPRKLKIPIGRILLWNLSLSEKSKL